MKEILKKYWGYDSFRPMQEEIISSALSQDDVLAILPTGGGKSVCFQVPSLMREGITIVVSPLIALMKDQVENLKKRGIPALSIYSGMTYREIDITLDNAIYGDYKFLYVSPERLRTELFKVRVSKMNVNYLVVDEAHCISQWGHDFRPDYLEISKIREILDYQCQRRIPCIALTATATPFVANEIMTLLKFNKPNLLRSGFERPNLSYVFRKVEDKLGYLLKVCSNPKTAGSGIVYASKRKTVEQIALFLQSRGVSAHPYHAGMSREMRSEIQDKWVKDETRVIVATNAFGMGIDKPNVRFVCHFDLPDSVEGYFQEAGRAGRDGLRSYTVLLWNDADVLRLQQITRSSYPPLEYIREIYQKVFTFLGFGYEQGKDMSVEFNIEEFAKKYKLHSASAYYAIKYIEYCGYWNLTEEVELPSRIEFIVNRDALYKIQLNSQELDTFINVLLRLYSGLFSGYVAIDEQHIAKMGRYAVASVSEKLIRLSRMKIISFIPKSKSPMINFNYERLVDKNLRLPVSEYKEKVERHTSRINAMIEMVRDGSRCRSVSLLNYFGQEVSSPCGMCDVCMAKNNVKSSSPDDMRYLSDLLKQFGGDKYRTALYLKQNIADEDHYSRLVELLRDEINLSN